MMVRAAFLVPSIIIKETQKTSEEPDRIVSFDWSKYDQGNVVYRPAGMMDNGL